LASVPVADAERLVAALHAAGVSAAAVVGRVEGAGKGQIAVI
jgi:hypothetical protein